MLSFIPFFLVVLAVAVTGLPHNSARLSGPPSLRSIVRRQISQNNTTTNSTSSNTNVTAGIVPLVLASDRETYYSVISIGEINFRVAIDTASSDIWVVSSGCNATPCKSLPRYPLTYDSPSFVPVNNNETMFNVSFEDTTYSSGFVAQELINIGNLTVTQQAFGLMNSTNISFVDQVSGVFGLGFPRLSTIHHLIANDTPFFAELAQTGKLEYPFFGVSLERNMSNGYLSIGAIDSEIVTNVSLIEWMEVIPFEPFGFENNVSSYLQWAIPISNVTVGNQTFTLEPTYPQENSNHSVALFDIGTPGIFGPYQDVERIFSVIDGSRLVDSTGQWAIPCDTNLTMTITFSQDNYTLFPSNYLIGPTSAETALCLAWPKASLPSSDGIDWQMGSAFLQTVYTVFSYGIAEKELPLIGLYPRQSASAALSPASLSALFSSLTLTVPTTLPNFVVPTPTLTTPPYIFNTSIPTSVLALSDLATSTYSPLIEEIVNGVVEKLNVTALPGVTPMPTIETFFLTDASGSVHTSVSPLPLSSVVLGRPPGVNSASEMHRPYGIIVILGIISTLLLAFNKVFL